MRFSLSFKMVTNLEVNLLSTMPQKMLFKEKLAFYQPFVLFEKCIDLFFVYHCLLICKGECKADF